MSRKYGNVVFDAKANIWKIVAEPQVLMRLRRMFATAGNQRGKVVKLDNTGANCLDLSWFLKRYPMDVSGLDLLLAGAREHHHRGELVAEVLAGTFTPQPACMALPPRTYQLVPGEIMLRSGRVLCADDMGLGKTVEAIYPITSTQCRPALVVTLTYLCQQWFEEFRRFAPQLRVVVVKKGTPYDLDRVFVRGRWQTTPPPDVIVLNYEKLRGWADTLAGKVKCVVFDECQELRGDKQPNSEGKKEYPQKVIAAKHVARRATFRMGLSGTPVYNYGKEIWRIFQVLAPGELGTSKEFSDTWGTGGMDRGRERVKDPKALGAALREGGLLIRRTRKDVGRELPGLTKCPQIVDANPEAIERVAKNASEMARMLIAGAAPHSELFTASGQFEQAIRQATGLAKAPAVAAFVRLLVEAGEHPVLFGWHHSVYDVWKEALKDLAPAVYTGEQSTGQKIAARESFIKGDSPVLIISLRAGAGLDGLQRISRTVVFGELDWSPAVHDQCTARVFRDGQPDPVVAYYLLAETGSDPVISDVLGIKREQAEGIRDANTETIADRVDPQHIRRLAEDFLRQRGERVPQRTQPPSRPVLPPTPASWPAPSPPRK